MLTLGSARLTNSVRPESYRCGMVVEMLTFEINRALIDEWIMADREIWTTFLGGQPGFVNKEVWISEDDQNSTAGGSSETDSKSETVAVHAVIWWSSYELWKSISMEQVGVVDAEMTARLGHVSPPPTMRSFTTVA